MATKKPAYEAPTPAADKKKALETALKQIEKSFGKGTCGSDRSCQRCVGEGTKKTPCAEGRGRKRRIRRG